jgi:Zn-finger nucleic acid-binding protein
MTKEIIRDYFCPKCGRELNIVIDETKQGSMSCPNCLIVFWLDYSNYPKALTKIKEIFNDQTHQTR